MSIALLCPTRGRPEQFKRMCESVKSTSQDINNVFIFHGSDDPNCEYSTKRFRENYPTVAKWNDLASSALLNQNIKLFMLAADDIIFETPGWDKALLDHYNNLENKIHVYALQDSRDPDGNPHPIVTREYINAMGYFLPPIFLHWFVDSWTCNIARSNSCFSFLRDYLLTHNKPSDHGQPDETHLGIRRMGWHERDTYVNATCQHFLEAEKIRLAKHMSTKHHMFFRQGMEIV